MATDNRITIPQGFYLDYVERFCEAHNIDNVGDAIQLLIGDHARLIGVDGISIAKTESRSTPAIEAPPPKTADSKTTNLLAGMI